MIINDIHVLANKTKQEAEKQGSPIREGQAYFNATYDLLPEIATSLVSSNVDPYYDDSKIDKFLERVEELYNINN